MPPFTLLHLLIELGLQRVLREDVKAHLPVAEEHGRLEHDQRLLQPVAAGHHSQVNPELGRHGVQTPSFPRPPRKKKNKLNLKKLKIKKKPTLNGWNISKHEQAQSVIFYKVISILTILPACRKIPFIPIFILAIMR